MSHLQILLLVSLSCVYSVPSLLRTRVTRQLNTGIDFGAGAGSDVEVIQPSGGNNPCPVVVVPRQFTGGLKFGGPLGISWDLDGYGKGNKYGNSFGGEFGKQKGGSVGGSIGARPIATDCVFPAQQSKAASPAGLIQSPPQPSSSAQSSNVLIRKQPRSRVQVQRHQPSTTNNRPTVSDLKSTPNSRATVDVMSTESEELAISLTESESDSSNSRCYDQAGQDHCFAMLDADPGACEQKKAYMKVRCSRTCFCGAAAGDR